MKKKNLIFVAFILLGLFGFMSIKAMDRPETNPEKNLNTYSGNKIAISLSTGNFIQGQCDGSPTPVCDMIETNSSRTTSSGSSSAKISINNAKASIDFLKYNLNPNLKSQLLKGTYTLNENFRIEQDGLNNVLGFAGAKIELKAGTYPVTNTGGMFTISIPIQNGSRN